MEQEEYVRALLRRLIGPWRMLYCDIQGMKRANSRNFKDGEVLKAEDLMCLLFFNEFEEQHREGTLYENEKYIELYRQRNPIRKQYRFSENLNPELDVYYTVVRTDKKIMEEGPVSEDIPDTILCNNLTSFAGDYNHGKINGIGTGTGLIIQNYNTLSRDVNIPRINVELLKKSIIISLYHANTKTLLPCALVIECLDYHVNFYKLRYIEMVNGLSCSISPILDFISHSELEYAWDHYLYSFEIAEVICTYNRLFIPTDIALLIGEYAT